MNVKYLVQYKHPIYHKWITDEKCHSLQEAHDTVDKKKQEVKELIKDGHTTLTWRILPLD